MAEVRAPAGSRLAGVAVGLVATPRFRRALDRHGERLLLRVFTPDEVAYASRKRHSEHNLAARFAAKCAGRRLLRPLAGCGVRLSDIEVVRRRSGEPTLRVLGRARAALPGDGWRFSLTLTHDADFAMASVWLERQEG